jgi:hypothetical protein
MKGLSGWLQPGSYWLVVRLITKWGAALVMIGTLALAASASAYLTRTNDHQAQAGGSVPGAVTPVLARSSCASLLARGALAPPAQCNTPIQAQSLCTSPVLGGTLTCTGTLPPYLR